MVAASVALVNAVAAVVEEPQTVPLFPMKRFVVAAARAVVPGAEDR